MQAGHVRTRMAMNLNGKPLKSRWRITYGHQSPNGCLPAHMGSSFWEIERTTTPPRFPFKMDQTKGGGGVTQKKESGFGPSLSNFSPSPESEEAKDSSSGWLVFWHPSISVGFNGKGKLFSRHACGLSVFFFGGVAGSNSEKEPHPSIIAVPLSRTCTLSGNHSYKGHSQKKRTLQGSMPFFCLRTGSLGQRQQQNGIGPLGVKEERVPRIKTVRMGPYSGWLRNPLRTTLKPWLKPLFVGMYRGIIILGFLGWREMDFVHPQYGLSRDQFLQVVSVLVSS